MIRILLTLALANCGTMEGDVLIEQNPQTKKADNNESDKEEITPPVERSITTENDPDLATDRADNDDNDNDTDVNVNVDVDVDVTINNNGDDDEDIENHGGLLRLGMTKKEVLNIFDYPTVTKIRTYPDEEGIVWEWHEDKRGEKNCMAKYRIFDNKCQIEFDEDGLVDNHEKIKAELVDLLD